MIILLITSLILNCPFYYEMIIVLTVVSWCPQKIFVKISNSKWVSPSLLKLTYEFQNSWLSLLFSLPVYIKVLGPSCCPFRAICIYSKKQSGGEPSKIPQKRWGNTFGQRNLSVIAQHLALGLGKNSAVVSVLNFLWHLAFTLTFNGLLFLVRQRTCKAVKRGISVCRSAELLTEDAILFLKG